MPDLFGWDPPERANRKPLSSGHPWPVGSGPDTETCRTCRHFVTLHLSKTSTRCDLMRKAWGKLKRPNVRATDAACLKWSAK